MTDFFKRIFHKDAKIQDSEENCINEIEGREQIRKRLSNAYENWITSVEESYKQTDYNALGYHPKISVVIPVYNVLDKHLIPCIESVINQSYTNWELCLADDCSTWKNVKETLDKYAGNDKIKVKFREENGHISEATNSALDMATGDFIAFMDCDDTLSSNALGEVVKLLNENPLLDFIYSDEDKIDDNGENRHMPHFKPDWSPDTLMSHMYTCHFGVYRKKIVDELGGLRKGFEGAQDYDFTLRFTEKTDRIGHISKILYHWREREESTAGSTEAKGYVVEAAKKSKQEALKRRGLKAELELVEWGSQYNINYEWEQYPKVSILILSEDPSKRLRCVTSVYNVSRYKDFEVLVVDLSGNKREDSQDQILLREYPVKMIQTEDYSERSVGYQKGVEMATGEYLLFLDENIEIVKQDWLYRIVGQAMLPHVGAVSAKILYADQKTIYRTGIVMTENNPMLALRDLPDDRPYYFLRNVINYNWLAVPGECLVLSREKYDKAGGVSDGLSASDIMLDLCLKLVENGYFNVVRNDVSLIFHGEEKNDGADCNYAWIQKSHPKFCQKDPFYNINLSMEKNDFSYRYMIDSLVRKVEERAYRTDGILYAVDEIKSQKEHLEIRGWIFVKDVKDSDIWNKYVILEDLAHHDFYEIKARITERPDVKEAMQKFGNFEFAGYEAVVKKGVLPDGRYRVILRIKDYAVYTDRIITIGE